MSHLYMHRWVYAYTHVLLHCVYSLRMSHQCRNSAVSGLAGERYTLVKGVSFRRGCVCTEIPFLPSEESLLVKKCRHFEIDPLKRLIYQRQMAANKQNVLHRTVGYMPE